MFRQLPEFFGYSSLHRFNELEHILMKKLTNKTWYKIVTDEDGSYVEIYGILKASGERALMGTCHVSCLEVIRQAGTIYAENVVIRWTN